MQAPSAPGSGDKFEPKALTGALLHITATEHVRDIVTEYGTADAIRADIAVLDGERKGDTLEDTLVFPKVLVSQLRDAVAGADHVVLGRLVQGTAKPGKSAPWLLDTPTEADLETGRKYEAFAAKRAADVEEPW